MSDLDAPNTAGELYEARADEVTIARPILQGDVFKDVSLPGLDDGSNCAIVLSHACSMRQGTKLRDRITMARVEQASEQLSLSEWPRKFFYVMPLPELTGSEDNDYSYRADFNQVTSVRSETLERSKRIACLSDLGLQLMLQRQVYHYTRVYIDLPTIHRELASVLTEIELCQDWVEEALEANDETGGSLSVVLEQEGRFQDFLGGPRDEAANRQLLKSPNRHAQLRRIVRDEIKTRFRST